MTFKSFRYDASYREDAAAIVQYMHKHDCPEGIVFSEMSEATGISTSRASRILMDLGEMKYASSVAQCARVRRRWTLTEEGRKFFADSLEVVSA